MTGRKIVMLGLPGAGKGTQAEKLSQYLGVPHISTGDIFRDAARRETSLGLKAKEIMKEGGLVSDDTVLGIVKDRLNQPDTENGYILDGFPRTLNQAKEFDKFEKPDVVLYVELPADEAVNRLKGRRVCSKCRAQYNIYLDDKGLEKCRKCGGELIQREDDREETVKIRIDNYRNQTDPLVDYYRQKGILKTIDGDQKIESVFESVKSVLE